VNHWILHADLDAFYASVEQLDRPELRGKPVVVGGPPQSRGVVTTASYEARPFGVRSAMPMSRALRLCPQAIRVNPRFDRYAEVSRQVMAIFRSVTPLVEPMSLDEAFLDVTQQAESAGGPDALAREIKRRVKAETGLTVSVGVATNKSVAKIASDMQKPNGLVFVRRGQEARFLAPLPVRALPGIGPRAEEALKAAGIQTIGQIAQADRGLLQRLFGSRAGMLQAVARGLDDRPLETYHERKSVGAENTFPRDLPDGPELRDELRRLATGVAGHLRRKGLRARTVAVKLRYSNFKTITRQRSLPEATDDLDQVLTQANSLLDAVLEEGDRFRLLGIHVTNLVGETREEAGPQLPLWGIGD
jgi:DNA polymerase-4